MYEQLKTEKKKIYLQKKSIDKQGICIDTFLKFKRDLYSKSF
jgi:hypothetical protein